MAFLSHRCERCKHPKSNTNRAGTCNGGNCPCAAGEHSYGPSVVIPTRDGRGKPVTELTAPGGRVLLGDTACDCGDCKAKYAELTASA